MKAVLNVHFVEGFPFGLSTVLMIIEAGFPIRFVSSPKYALCNGKKSETNRKLNALIDQYDFS